MQFALVASLLVFVSAGSHVAPPPQPHGVGRSAIASGDANRLSDAEIRKRMIAESIEAYPGPCACPYQRASNGSQCGRRSAYSRAGGYDTLCYASDISDEMVKSYRAQKARD